METTDYTDFELLALTDYAFLSVQSVLQSINFLFFMLVFKMHNYKVLIR